MASIYGIVSVTALLLMAHVDVDACAATASSPGTEVTTTTTTESPACAACTQLAVLTGSGLASDGTVTHSFSTNAQGCRQDELTCTGTADSFATIFYYLNGESIGSDGGTASTDTELFTCNSSGQWEHTSTTNGQTSVVDTVECLYA